MKTISDAHLHGHLGFWLRRVSNRVSGGFAAKLAGRGITVAEWVALREIYGGEIAPSVLAERLGMTRGAITKLAAKLIRRKLLVRRADDSDGRAQRLGLTAAGHALVPELTVLADRNDAEYFSFLTKSERRALEKLLKRIVRQHGLTLLPTG